MRGRRKSWRSVATANSGSGRGCPAQGTHRSGAATKEKPGGTTAGGISPGRQGPTVSQESQAYVITQSDRLQSAPQTSKQRGGRRGRQVGSGGSTQQGGADLQRQPSKSVQAESQTKARDWQRTHPGDKGQARETAPDVAQREDNGSSQA